MTFHYFFPDNDANDRILKEKIKKHQKQIEQEKQGHAIMLRVPNLTKEYKVLEQSNDHVVIDLQQSGKKVPTVKEFTEVLGL